MNASDDLLEHENNRADPTHAIIDMRTGATVGTYSSMKRAARAADKKDLEYGAVRYVVQPIKLNSTP